MWNYMVLSLAHLKCAFEILLYNQFSFPEPDINKYYCAYSNITLYKPGSEEVMRVTRLEYSKEKDNNDDDHHQCAVCLCEVKEGDEIAELRCCHVLHFRCLERWVVGSKQRTCPLCRGTLAPPLRHRAEAVENKGVEVLFFKFCSFSSYSTSQDHGERDSWWLR
ncbi:ERAD-associated E3 ubiquitin-protein ligase HRD1-like [Humulus lupulus]|uniref:ERAD-associated E3 ubiquitin-protein ligase HRD1-like n=1 Tax=Humulus lupulus TaxID=3486 RepID=UPI002B412B4A|nr:ERAD-associated E3 ubiquitin-protein ligase HRD1-like [Humulus lupulus]